MKTQLSISLFFALVAFIQDCGCSVQYDNDRGAIDFLYSKCGGQDWYESKEDHCAWEKVECDEERRITELNISSQEMSCKFSETEFSFLTHLKVLDIRRNKIGGTIPPGIRMFSHLELLNLDENLMTGTIPTLIERLTSLTSLSLENNTFTGMIPSEIGKLTLLEFLNLDENSMNGTIPTLIERLTSLTSLTLDENFFTGVIPSEIGKLTLLEALDLDDNSFTGAIPSEIWKMTQLTSLDLDGNDLTGELSLEVGKLTKLVKLDLDENALTGTLPNEVGLLTMLTELQLYANSFTGLIPTAFANLTNLTILHLDNNGLSDRIPSEIVKLPLLEELRLAGNLLCGSIPSELGAASSLKLLNLDENLMNETIPTFIKKLTILTSLHLDDNSFTGTISSEIWKMTQLTSLDLDGNDLTGELSVEVGKLTNLEKLDLDKNALTGTLPSEVGSLTMLTSLQLYANTFRGPIPTTFANLTNLTILHLDNNALSGKIPSEIGKLRLLEVLRLEGNSLSGSIPSELGGASHLKILHLFKNGLNDKVSLLTGRIPSEIGKMSLLEELRLECNSLSGSIPSELGAASQLKILHLFKNELNGKFPVESQFLTDLEVLRLEDNQLSGAIPSEFGLLTNLQILRLQDNSFNSSIPSELGSNLQIHDLNLTRNDLTGSIPSEMGQIQSLKTLDLSQNGLSGSIPSILGNMSNLIMLLLDHNKLTGVFHFELFESKHVLEKLDLSSNRMSISLNSGSSIWNSGLKIKHLFLSNNAIEGQINMPAEATPNQYLQTLHVGSNCLTGSLPPLLFYYLPQLRHLDLSGRNDCKKCFEKEDCTDKISKPGELCCEGTLFCFEFEDRLIDRCISGDEYGISDKIPTNWANSEYLMSLNLSENILSGQIPSSFGYGRGLPRLREIDLSSNSLTGRIPSELGDIGCGVSGNVTIRVEGNKFDQTSLAPLNLCSNPKFNFYGDERMCPVVREILNDLFKSTFGEEWTHNRNWGDHYIHPCGNEALNFSDGWYGVNCSGTNIAKINLTKNDLAGKISEIRLEKLSSLESFVLRDNGIHGEIPSSLTKLASLKELDLSYNNFGGEIPDIILPNITKLRFQANRLVGNITRLPGINRSKKIDFSFISDCGFPSKMREPIKCENCTMCCNSHGECEAKYNENNSFDPLDNVLEDSLERFLVTLLIILLACAIASIILFYGQKYLYNGIVRDSDDRIFTWIGGDSVYKYILMDSVMGWIAAAAIAAAQLSVLFIFYREAALDFDREYQYDLAWTYTYKCPPDIADKFCREAIKKQPYAWLVVIILLILNLGADMGNGFKLLWIAPMLKKRRFRAFIGGAVLMVISCMSIFTSLIFNWAEAKSSTEFIINAAILLFVNNLDEMCLNIIETFFNEWFKKLEKKPIEDERKIWQRIWTRISTFYKWFQKMRISTFYKWFQKMRISTFYKWFQKMEDQRKIWQRTRTRISTLEIDLESEKKRSSDKIASLDRENKEMKDKISVLEGKIGRPAKDTGCYVESEIQLKLLFLEKENQDMKKENQDMKGKISHLETLNRDMMRKLEGEVLLLKTLMKTVTATGTMADVASVGSDNQREDQNEDISSSFSVELSTEDESMKDGLKSIEYPEALLKEKEFEDSCDLKFLKKGGVLT